MQQLLLIAFSIAMCAVTTFAADGPVRHVVHFKFKSDASQADIEKVTREFAALKTKIPGVEHLEWGTNSSKEGLDKGFTHCWILGFKDAAARDAYLIHPEHKKFVEIVKPILDEVLVVDFVVQK
jgi:hypothetical protein